ncbi:hypothetical protein [Pontibacter akesuensis]|uniref:Uncharacterized protein n=1 Tax=Pontibacter akesuensis TaxID=388950 RepID=A0A1I7IK98_9BACT|nr:hypothetical protein [Pontibacter akesuensis]GHA67598.1 hypothetical protein GCM10007389_21030 [Pontibacter akesuensis]SFU73354.1 hypothetical protein SAMN04487941_2275 [Pontibacter akesuensis]
MTQQTEVAIPKGQLYFGVEKLLLLDRVYLKLVRTGIALCSLYMLLLLINNLEVSAWQMAFYVGAWVLTAVVLFLLRHHSDAKAISYAQMQEVTFKKARFGYTNPVMEVLFLNERQVLKKRYVQLTEEQIADVAAILRIKGVVVEA